MKKTYYFRKSLDYLGVGFLLALLYFLWVLYQGPLSVPFLKPYIIQALNSEENEYTVNVAEVNLELVRSVQPVKIIAKDVSFRQKNDNLTIMAPKLSLSFSVRALLKGIIAPSSITFEGPQMSFFNSYGLEKNKVNEINKKKIEFYVDWFESFLERFNAQEKIYAESFINEISINDASVDVHEVDLGKKLSFKNVNIAFKRHLTNLEIRTEGLLDMKDRLAGLSVNAVYRPVSDKLNIDFDFSDFLLSDLLNAFENNAPEMNLPIKGDFHFLVNFAQILQNKDDLINSLDKAVEKIVFHIKGGQGEISFNQEEKFNYAVDSFALDGKISGGFDSVSIENAEFEIGGRKTLLGLDIAGYKEYFFEKSLKDLKIIFTAQIPELPMDELSKFWPKYLAEPAWQWCKDNLYGGLFKNAFFKFEFGYDEKQNNLFLKDLSGKAEIENGNVSYLGEMPAVEHVYGEAFVTDSSIDVKIDKGVADGVIVDQGRVLLYDLNTPHNFIDIQIKGNSSISDALIFISHPPLEFTKSMGFDPEKIQGDVDLSLGLNFELHDHLKPEDVKVDVKAKLIDFKIPDVGDGKTFRSPELNLEVNSKGFVLLGEAFYDDIALNLVVNETFANRQYKSKAKMSFKLDDEVKKKLKIDMPVLNAPYVEGYADVTADVTVLDNGRTLIDLEADLRHEAVDFSFLGFKKEKNQPGNIKVKLEFLNGKLLAVPDFGLTKQDFSLSGKMSLNSKGKLNKIDINRIEGEKISAKAKILLSEKPEKITVDISGSSYNLTPLFEKKEKKRSQNISAANDSSDSVESLPDMDISIVVNSLWTNHKTPIKNFSGNVIIRKGLGIQEAHLLGNYGTDRSIKLNLDYVPRPNGEYLLSINSNNAGSTLRVLRLYEDMSGGILKIEAKRSRDKKFVGHAQIRDFSLHNTPLMAKLLTVASLSGIVNLLTGEGLNFSHFDAPFEYQNETLLINDAKMFGNVLGLTGNGVYHKVSGKINIEGIVSPAYSLNSFIGKIPVVGTLLAGKDGTVFALSYKIDGFIDDPKISINPLSMFSPNSIKDLFSSSGRGNGKNN